MIYLISVDTNTPFADFALTTTGAISGVMITGVTDTGDQTSYTVTVNTGNGNGTIRLDALDNGSILDLSSNPLSGGFTGGQEYKIEKDADVEVHIGGQLRGSYVLESGQEKWEYYDVSGRAVVVESNNENIVSAIRLQSFASNTLYSFVETMGVPAGLLSHKYYFPTYNNSWAPLNSQLRLGMP